MIQLKTRQEIKYNSRSNRYGIVFFELQPIKASDGYNCTVIDSVEKTIISKDLDGNDIVASYKEQLFSRNVFLANAEIDALFAMIAPSLPNELSYLQKENLLFTQAFLYYITHDFLLDDNGKSTGKLIYGLKPEDIEIV